MVQNVNHFKIIKVNQYYYFIIKIWTDKIQILY